MIETREKDIHMLMENARRLQMRDQQETSEIRDFSYVIKLTHSCNLDCEYCYMGQGSNINMSEKMFFNILNFIADNKRDTTIYLHGGEPFLRKDLIVQLDKYLDHSKKNLHFRIQTNGTIRDPVIFEIIKKRNIQLGVSLDGVDFLSNSTRDTENGSITKTVLRTLDDLTRMNISFGVFIVLTKKNADSILDTIRFLHDQGVNGFVINPLVLWGKAKNRNDLQPSDEQVFSTYKKVFDWISKTNATSLSQVNERNLHWWYTAVNTGEKGYMCNMSPCGAGRRTVAIGPDGDVFLCDQFYGDPRFSVGNLKDYQSVQQIHLEAEKKTIILRDLHKVEVCKTCKWRFVCCGGCPAVSYYHYQSMQERSPFCKAYRELFAYMELVAQKGTINI